MQSFFERARQALGVGPDAFLPSNLDAQATTLKELDVFAPNLRDMLKATQAFADHTNKYLETTASYITEAPFPQLWMQGSPSEPATTTQMPVPTQHAAWFDAGVAEHEAGIVPSAVGCALRAELVAPMEQWLWTYQVAQGQLSRLEGKRLAYDAERRRLVQHATTATTAPPPAAAPIVEDPELAQLAEDAAAVNARLSEFESDVEALDDLLHWLVEGAVRLKALLADAAGGVGVAADSWTIPPGIMPPFPEKSSFGRDLEVTVKNVSDSPGGPEEMVASSTATSASEAGGVTTVTSFTPHSKSHMGAATAAGDTQPQPLPDLSKILPADDALVYAGGAPPAAGTGLAEPPGGGVGQMLKDTLITPTDADDTEVLNLAAPEVSSRSAHSYSGQGTGCVEARMADAAAAGMGAAHRRMGRSRSADSPGSAAAVTGGKSGAKPMGEEASASDKQLLAIVPSPTTSSDSATSSSSSAAAAAGPSEAGSINPSSPAADTAGMMALHPSQPTDTADTLSKTLSEHDNVLDNYQGSTIEDDDPAAAQHSSSSSGTAAEPTAVPQAGGIWVAVKRTAAAAGSAAAAAGSVAAATASALLQAVPVPGITHDGFGSQPSSEAGDDDADSAADESSFSLNGAGGHHSTALHSHPLTQISFDQREEAAAAAARAAAAAEGSGTYAGALVGSQLDLGPHEVQATQQQGEGKASQSSAAEQGSSSSSSSGAGGDPKAVWTGEVVEAFQQGQGKHAGDPPAGSTTWLDHSSWMAGLAVSGGSAATPTPTPDDIKDTAHRVRESLSTWSETTGGDSSTGAEAPVNLGPVALPEAAIVHSPTTKSARAEEWHLRHGPAPSSTPTAPGPNKGTWVKDSPATAAAAAAGKMEGSDTSAARDQEQGHMHIGPVTPSSGPSEPAPGSATWVKGPTVPGGAAAGGVHVRDETGGSNDTDVIQGRMHICPVLGASEDPSDLAPGGAIWAKGPTPPGGAAAAAAPAGSNADTDLEQDSSSGSKVAPDLSKVLPTYEHGGPKVHSKPEGGSFGAFIKDTLLGPKREA